MRFVLLHEGEESAMRLAFALESTFSVTVDVVSSVDAALELLRARKGPRIELAVYDLQAKGEKEFARFRNAAQEIACLRCVASDAAKLRAKAKELHGDGPLRIIDRANLVDELLATVDGLEKDELIQKPENHADFVRVDTRILGSVAPLQGDIYICLSEKRGKYVKLFHQGDEFEKSDFERYTLKKEVQFLYIREGQVKEYLERFRAQLSEMLGSATPPGPATVAEQSEKVVETLQEIVARVGFTPEAQELAKTQVAVTVKAMGKSPTLAQILETLQGQGESYIPAHSHLTAHIACAIASKLDWGSEITYSKLTLAAMIHDVTLNHQELARCRTVAEAEKLAKTPSAGISREQLEAFKAHPGKAAEMVRGMSEVPADVDVIIIQHHEQPNGSGFPRGLTQMYIAPLAAVFIVAHELAQRMMEDKGKNAIADFAAQARRHYTQGQFRKVVAALEKVAAE